MGGGTFRHVGKRLTLGSGGPGLSSLASILATADPTTLAQLTDGDFYRGFMTIDVVTTATDKSPFSATYPFGTSNDILGSIYYLRLNEGSANGLPMVGLEYIDDTGVSIFLEGFYGSDDHREEIDDNGRECGAGLTQGITPCGGSDQEISAIRARVFRSAPLSGTTRVIVFTWTTEEPADGGPSAICGSPGFSCAESYNFYQYREDGSFADSGTLTLPHVRQYYRHGGEQPQASSTSQESKIPKHPCRSTLSPRNAASPEGNPNINWDANFPSEYRPPSREGHGAPRTVA